jgi:hypothetical protein
MKKGFLIGIAAVAVGAVLYAVSKKDTKPSLYYRSTK